MSVDDKPAKNKDYVIRSVNPPVEFANLPLKHFRKSNFKKFGIIKTDDPFLNALAEGLRSGLIQGEEVVIEENVVFSDNDFKSLALKIKAKKVNVLGVYLLSGQAGLFLSQAGRIGLKVPSLGTDVFESENEIKRANGFMEGAVYANLKVPDDFYQRYLSKYSSTTHIPFAYNAYQFLKLIALAPKNLNWENPNEIISFLESDASKKVGWGFINSPEVGKYYRSDLVLKTIKNGRVVEIE